MFLVSGMSESCGDRVECQCELKNQKGGMEAVADGWCWISHMSMEPAADGRHMVFKTGYDM